MLTKSVDCKEELLAPVDDLSILFIYHLALHRQITFQTADVYHWTTQPILQPNAVYQIQMQLGNIFHIHEKPLPTALMY